MRFGAVLVVGLLAIGSALVAGQRGWFDGFEALRSTRIEPNTPYDGRFTFVRINYDTLPGGYWYRGQPAWSHGYPLAERNLMQILNGITSISLHLDEVNTLALDDPAIFDYPVIYLIEPSWWNATDAEVKSLRAYLDKGGFVIIDDFKTPGRMGGRGWDQFAETMARVVPEGRFVELDVSHPLFHQFFDISSLDIFPQAYNAGRPYFRGLYRNNDPFQPLQMVVFYNTDISQFWEWSTRGFRSISETNEAYKLGVNSILYGLLH